jgi:hypothetical protein
MKLLSFAKAGRASYGVVVGDKVVDLGARLGPNFRTHPAKAAVDAARVLAKLTASDRG